MIRCSRTVAGLGFAFFAVGCSNNAEQAGSANPAEPVTEVQAEPASTDTYILSVSGMS